MNTPKLIRAWRFCCLFIHLALGILEVATIFPWRKAAYRSRAIQRWSQRMCRILHIEVSVHGSVHTATHGNAMLVSWIDIFVLDTATVARFVAKAEVRAWPLIGWLCAHTGTLFVTREKRQDTHRVNKEISNALAQGDCIAVFPEGSTTDGFDVIPFNASLLQPAVDAGASLAPVALRYYDYDGKRSDAASYVGEMSLIESIFRILAQREIKVRLDYLPAVSAIGRHRRELARDVQAQICAVILQDSPIAAHTSMHVEPA
jgi:1-acyl-sn-glycerol-3-phosphate acyltransferase